MIHSHLSALLVAFHLSARVMLGCGLCFNKHSLRHSCLQRCSSSAFIHSSQGTVSSSAATCLPAHWFEVLSCPILSINPAATLLLSDIHAAYGPQLPLPSWPQSSPLTLLKLVVGMLPNPAWPTAIDPTELCWAQLRLVQYLMSPSLLSSPRLDVSLGEFPVLQHLLTRNSSLRLLKRRFTSFCYHRGPGRYSNWLCNCLIPLQWKFMQPPGYDGMLVYRVWTFPVMQICR